MLVLALVVGINALAYDFEVDGFYYSITSSDDLTVSVTPGKYTGYVVIPSTVTNGSKTYSVTSIGENAFKECSELTSVTIQDGVTLIGPSSFYKCTGLTTINIPDGVTAVCNYAFDYCSNLTTVSIPSSVTWIGWQAFWGCDKLQYNEVDNVLYIGNADNPCVCMMKVKDTSVASCTINENTKVIYVGAFNGCTGITSLSIPNSVTWLCQGAVAGCAKLQYNEYGNALYVGNADNPYIYLVKAKDKSITSCTINKNTKAICIQAFYNCENLTSVTIPEGVTKICDTSFGNCKSLTSITIPSSVTMICEGAFGYVPMASVTIPSSVTWIGKNAFGACSKLKTVYTDNANAAMLKAELGTSRTYEVACTVYDNYAAAGLTAVTQHNNVSKTNAIAATCTTGGNSAYYTCSDCNKYFSNSGATIEIEKDSWVTSAKNHSWGGWTTTKAATCIEKGSKQRVCANDASHIDQAEIEIDDTNHADVVTDNAVDATCTATGLKEGSHCEACHTTIVAQETIPVLEHLFTSYTYNNDATTEADGTETAHCDRNCGAKDSHIAEGTRLQTPTPVEDIKAEKQGIIKTVENGKIVIVKDGERFDLSGAKLR